MKPHRLQAGQYHFTASHLLESCPREPVAPGRDAVGPTQARRRI